MTKPVIHATIFELANCRIADAQLPGEKVGLVRGQQKLARELRAGEGRMQHPNMIGIHDIVIEVASNYKARLASTDHRSVRRRSCIRASRPDRAFPEYRSGVKPVFCPEVPCRRTGARIAPRPDTKAAVFYHGIARGPARKVDQDIGHLR